MKEKRITVFKSDGSQETMIIEPDTRKLTERERLNSMTEEEIERNALDDPDALPVEDEAMWERGRWVHPITHFKAIAATGNPDRGLELLAKLDASEAGEY